MELDELHVLQRQAGAEHHGIAVAGAGVRAGRRVIAAPVAARGEHDGLRAVAVDRAVIHVERDDAAAHAVFHDQVEREIFDEEVGVILQALLVERVEHGVAGAVGGGAGALRGGAFAHVLGHAAERALVDLALVGAAERQAGMLELVDRGGRLAAQIFDRVLVAEPVGALDGVVHVPRPVVGAHVAEAGGDPALRRDGVAAGREDLGDAGGLEALLGRAHRRAKARAPGPDDDDVIDMVDDLVGAHATGAPKAMRASANRLSAAPAIAAILRTK